MFRECGECTACCTWPSSNIYGWEFGCGKSCKFLENNNCSIYKVRPQSCKDFQCAWLEGLLPEEMRPDKISVLSWLVTNVVDKSKTLKVYPFKESTKIDNNMKKWFIEWGEKMNIQILFIER